MKYFIIILFLISFVGFIIPQAFAAGENFFYGTTTFERLPTTIVPNNPTKFEIKFHYTAGSYALESLTPVIEVNPEDARSKVHFDVKPVSAYQNDIVRIPVTITVDPSIEYEKIFLSISYAGIGFRDVPFKSSWSDSIIFNIDHDVVDESKPFPLKQIKSGIIDKMQCKETILGVKYGKPINLQYDMDGGTIASICKIDDTNSVVTKIDAKSDGRITITIPKKIIYSLSSTNCDEDSDLIILMDNEEALPISTIHNKKDNVVTVEFVEGVHTIEFIGTTIMPDPSPSQYCGIVMGLDSQYLPPKFQIERGMKAEQVRCNNGLQLIIKSSNGNPACAKQETAEKLIERGWGSKLEDMQDSKTSIESLDKNYILQVNDNIFEIRYSIIGSLLQEIIVDINAKSLVINVEGLDNGHMVIEIPRNLIDARIGPDGKSGDDVDFFVLVDGSEVDFEETSSIVARTLTIPLKNGSSQIEIIGTIGHP